MAIRAPLGDRRSSLRFQVSGQLWASVAMRHEAVLRDITDGGALLEVSLGRGARSLRAGVIRLPQGGPEILVQVRRIVPVTDSPAEDRHLVGVEFVKVTGADRQAIRAFVQAAKQREILFSSTD